MLHSYDEIVNSVQILNIFQPFTVGRQRAPRDTAIINQPTERLPPTPPARPRISHLNSTFLFIFAHGATMCVPEPCVHASMPSVSVRPYCTHSLPSLSLCFLTSIPFTSTSPPSTLSLILFSTFILFRLTLTLIQHTLFQTTSYKNLRSANPHSATRPSLQPFLCLLVATIRSSPILSNLYCSYYLHSSLFSFPLLLSLRLHTLFSLYLLTRLPISSCFVSFPRS